MNIQTGYFCETYIADGKHVSACEPCESAEEAVLRAKKWNALGTKARAIKVEIDLDSYKMTRALL